LQEQLARPDIAFLGVFVEFRCAALYQIPRIQILRFLCRQTTILGMFQFGSHDCGYLLGQFVLQFEDVRELAIERFGPNVMTGFAIDELSRNADFVRDFADAPFQHISRSERLTNLLNIDGLAFEYEGGIPRNDGERAPERQGCDDVFREPVGEIFLLRVAAQIRER
jgi:hypothetical protein